MTAKVKYPSLSIDGWVNSSIKTADYIFSDFLTSQYSQSYLYYGNISSLSYILQKSHGNISSAIENVRSSLSNYFGKYFNSVLVEVNERVNNENPSFGAIEIYVQFTDSLGKSYSLGKLAEIADTKIVKVINIING